MWGREGQRRSLAPSLTDMHVADTEAETLRGEVDGAGVSHLRLRPLWLWMPLRLPSWFTGGGVGPLSAGRAADRRGPQGGPGRRRLSIDWDSNRDQRCQTWFLAINSGSRTSNHKSVIFLSSGKMKMPAFVVKNQETQKGAWGDIGMPHRQTNHCFHPDAKLRAETLQPGWEYSKTALPPHRLWACSSSLE